MLLPSESQILVAFFYLFNITSAICKQIIRASHIWLALLLTLLLTILFFFFSQTVSISNTVSPFLRPVTTPSNSTFLLFFSSCSPFLSSLCHISPPASFPSLPWARVSMGAAESRENSFSRSRSSSVSSIDRDTKEAITTLLFGESYGRKGDAVPTPCLWVGTSLGVVLLIPMSIPTDQEERMEEPVTIGPSGRSQEN